MKKSFDQMPVLPPTGFSHRAKVLRVLDGDTVEAEIYPIIGTTMTWHLRFEGINAPEIHGPSQPLGQAAKTFLETLLPVGTAITLLIHKLDKYGRGLAQVYLADGRCVNRLMLDAGQAVEYWLD